MEKIPFLYFRFHGEIRKTNCENGRDLNLHPAFLGYSSNSTFEESVRCPLLLKNGNCGISAGRRQSSQKSIFQGAQ